MNTVWTKGLVLLALFLCLFSFTCTAFAEPEDETAAVEEIAEEAPEGTSSANDGLNVISQPADSGAADSGTAVAEATPILPSGNLTLLEDVVSAVNGNREFLTVYSNDGHYFYIIIDRDNSGTGNVYFLNMVDDSDLYALTEGAASGSSGLINGLQKEVCTCTTHCTADHINESCKVCKKDFSKCECNVIGNNTDQPEQTEKKEGLKLEGWKKYALYGGVVVVIIGVFVVIAISRKKKNRKGAEPNYEISDFDEYEDDEEE